MVESKISPWLPGIVDTLCGAEIIRRSPIPHRNRLAVILIDSAFETACRAFLKHKARILLQESHRHRENLIKTVRSKLSDIDREVWDNINFYYTEIRCDFYHQSAGKTITDVSLLDYKDTVEFVINKAFGIQIGNLVSSELATAESELQQRYGQPEASKMIPLSEVNDRLDKIIVAVSCLSPRNVKEVNEFFKKEGETLRLKQPEFSAALARNSGSKKYFYYDGDLKRWILSSLGRFKLGQIERGVENE